MVKRTDVAIRNKLFKRLAYLKDQFCEVELVKLQIERKKSFTVGFLILEYDKSRLFELFYNFSKNCCDRKIYKVLEMDIDCLFSAIAQK